MLAPRKKDLGASWLLAFLPNFEPWDQPLFGLLQGSQGSSIIWFVAGITGINHYLVRCRDHRDQPLFGSLQGMMGSQGREAIEVGSGEGIPSFDMHIDVANAEQESLKFTRLLRPQWEEKDIRLKVGRVTLKSAVQHCETR